VEALVYIVIMTQTINKMEDKMKIIKSKNKWTQKGKNTFYRIWTSPKKGIDSDVIFRKEIDPLYFCGYSITFVDVDTLTAKEWRN